MGINPVFFLSARIQRGPRAVELFVERKNTCQCVGLCGEDVCGCSDTGSLEDWIIRGQNSAQMVL